jgi:L-erythro-3,5-diaminohexanoate dehydrogenase
MKVASLEEIGHKLGADRVLAPAGALPQPAERLDAAPPVRPHEFELEVERLCLDSTSHRNIRESCGGDPGRMAARIHEIVATRGKMHNPESDSGGVALGTVTAVGESLAGAPELGERVVTLASLTLTPLRIDEIAALDPGSPQVEVRGHAYVCERAPWGRLPDDLPRRSALELYDVYGAGSHTRDLAPARGTVCVLGAGHAGKLALAAARDVMEDGTLVAIDIDGELLGRVHALGLCDRTVRVDLRDPLAALEAYRAAGLPAADLTVAVASARGCEPTAILLTADRGTVLFFSMATSFQTAALTADGMGSHVRMLVGSGYAPDAGSYALDLARRSAALREAMAMDSAEAA